MARHGKASWIDGQPDVIRDGDRWITFGAMKQVAAWFEFLRFSPSYELARRYRAGEISPDAALPADFATVLAVYDDLGDVSGSMTDWWLGGANRSFGQGGENPRVVGVGVASSGQPEFDRVKDNVERYRQTEWISQGERKVMFVAIPVGLPKAQIAKQLGHLVDEFPPDEHVLSPQAPKYKITGKKIEWGTIYRYLRCLQAKADLADATLWQIGLRAEVSSTYAKLLNSSPPPPPHERAEHRQTLKIYTSRGISRGHMIAENAARGIFPTYAKCPEAVSMDWERVRQQREVWAAESLGDVEFDADPEFDPIWTQDASGNWFDARTKWEGQP